MTYKEIYGKIMLEILKEDCRNENKTENCKHSDSNAMHRKYFCGGGVQPLIAKAETTGTYGDLTYSTVDSDEDGTDDCVEITDCDTSVTEVDIPEEIEGLPVSSIGSYAFDLCSSLTSITIPDSMTSVGNAAFYLCISLTSITIPDSVTSIGNGTFLGCTSLASVTIGNGVTSIGGGAFNGCTSLVNITIPDITTSIGSHVFGSCTSLESIRVGKNNEYYCSVDGVLFNKNQTELIQYPMGNKKIEYSIPDSVICIEECAFSDCTNLESITIPDSVTYIGYCVFLNCSNLASITIPDSIMSIGDRAFYFCSSLSSITIPNNVTSIGDWAFRNCTTLSSITIPDSVTSIGEWAFLHCTSLASITIKNSECEIYDSEYTISDTATIYGYANSTAQAYAEKYNRTFVALDSEQPTETEPTTEPAQPSETIDSSLATKYGDLNNDDDVSISDVVKLNLYLLNKTENSLDAGALANADCVRDGIIDVSDSSIIMNYTAMMVTYDKLGTL